MNEVQMFLRILSIGVLVAGMTASSVGGVSAASSQKQATGSGTSAGTAAGQTAGEKGGVAGMSTANMVGVAAIAALTALAVESTTDGTKDSGPIVIIDTCEALGSCETTATSTATGTSTATSTATSSGT